MPPRLATLAECPELEAQIPLLHAQSWPAFIQADAIAMHYWGKLFSVFPEYQYLLCDENNKLIAAGHAIPLAWDGTIEHLPLGWDAALEQGFREAEQGILPTVLCGLSIVITPSHQGQGLSEMLVNELKALAALDGLDQVLIPVRPSLKSRYPLIPMQEYLKWQNNDGLPFDSWLRIHYRLGAQILSLAPRSMIVAGTISQWEQWTGMRFPASGQYLIEGALEPLMIDCENNTGRYEETNVWVCYSEISSTP